MGRSYKKMNEYTIQAIVGELDRWAAGQFGSGLTWKVIEERFGYTRQSMEKKPEIKAAFQNAKIQLEGGLVKTRGDACAENEKLLLENQRLRQQIKNLEQQRELWYLTWMRIVYHLRSKGIPVHQLDRPVDDDAELPALETTNEVIQLFNKPIPPSGRV